MLTNVLGVFSLIALCDAMRLLAIVITYYPDISNCVKNILRYIEYVDKLIIWENTPQKEKSNYKITISCYEDKIVYLGTGKNEGIAYPLNSAIQWAAGGGYTHLLTMDQDSRWENFQEYKNLILKYYIHSPILSPNINHTCSEKEECKVIPSSITSGSIYQINLFHKIGLFREDYFIDGVDTELCYRAKKQLGIDTLCLCKAHLQQIFGEPYVTFLGTTLSNYSAFRTYYILRNHIRLWKEYPSVMSFEFKKYVITDFMIKRLINIICFEKNKLQKIKSMVKGVSHGLK